MSSYIAFEGTRKIIQGDLVQVAQAVKSVQDRGERSPVLIFEESTSELVALDLRGTIDEAIAKLSAFISFEKIPDSLEHAPVRPGRPKLGVVAREVTLLPRHWDWLNMQPGGASVALRKLVEEARKANVNRDKIRQAQEVTYRFCNAMAGNESYFEEAIRALFAGNSARFEEHTQTWPIDVRDHARKLAGNAW